MTRCVLAALIVLMFCPLGCDDRATQIAIDAAAGLTRHEAENAFSLSLVRDGRLAPKTILSIKAQQLQQANLVTLHNSLNASPISGGSRL